MSNTFVAGKRVAMPTAKPAVPSVRIGGARRPVRVVCEAVAASPSPVASKAEAAAPASAPTVSHAEPAKKERAPVTDDALVALKALLKRSVDAQHVYSTFTQEQVDEIFRAAAEAANAARIPLAKMAVEETRMGVVEDKVVKNHFASEFIYNKFKHTKTCGVIEEDLAGGIQKIAEPVGVIAGIVPTTNPTSTAIFKSLLALKTRNALVLCPHPRAARSTITAAKIVHDAAVAAGAPEGIISWIENPSLPVSQALMQAPEISLILATGGPAMVRAAYSSGHPSLGVGAGNTPALIDETADVQMAVSSILLSKTFDNGVICASEQSVVVVAKAYDAVRAEFVRRGAYFLNEDDKVKVDYTKGLSKEAISLIFKYLPRAYANGATDFEAREKVHYAATIAGMAFANAFLGICHSMAHKLGGAFHVPHGLANAALISHVIRYNATDMPAKQAAFPQYQYPTAKRDYAELATMLSLGGTTDDEKVVKLIEAVENLKKQCDVPATIQEIFNDPKLDAEYLSRLDTIAEDAFDDQCTGANPRYPLIADLKQIYIDAHSAPILPIKSLEFFSKIV
ncbi:Aldehyde-alcohol dehydrogenase [Tetrabaena socialis]|uniref:Aldehyde-alcohol dehydrogenase n=1 Tax=Tetrabaena socialis TaxID=47790 RepID=A0A2J8A3E6_9CHLO|nr:Aldehyde-alcohol dehydrogenase [Tetrabaena socialis]|eukprot:PNH07040.1 Aldehyde-alcohol dehydrogenase [Tetrabaena socialis]